MGHGHEGDIIDKASVVRIDNTNKQKSREGAHYVRSGVFHEVATSEAYETNKYQRLDVKRHTILPKSISSFFLLNTDDVRKSDGI